MIRNRVCFPIRVGIFEGIARLQEFVFQVWKHLAAHRIGSTIDTFAWLGKIHEETHEKVRLSGSMLRYGGPVAAYEENGKRWPLDNDPDQGEHIMEVLVQPENKSPGTPLIFQINMDRDMYDCARFIYCDRNTQFQPYFNIFEASFAEIDAPIVIEN